jgi:hypothetical protein
MVQDSFDEAGSVDQADDLQRAGATGAEWRISLIDLLDQVRLRAFAGVGAAIAGVE